MIFQESKIEFHFSDEHWSDLLQFDKTVDYQNVSNSIPNTKGVDFTGIFQDRVMVFIEVKNYRNQSSDSIKLLESNSFLDKIAQKVRDSLSVILGRKRHSTHQEATFDTYINKITNKRFDIVVILRVEQNTRNPETLKNKMQHIRTILKGKLKWLTSRIYILDHNSANDHEIKGTLIS